MNHLEFKKIGESVLRRLFNTLSLLFKIKFWFLTHCANRYTSTIPDIIVVSTPFFAHSSASLLIPSESLDI